MIAAKLNQRASKVSTLTKVIYDVHRTSIGNPYTLRKWYPDERIALMECLEDGVSAKTNSHNFGMGLCDVASLVTSTDTLRIISGKAMLYEEKKNRKTFQLDWMFKGTLIYLTIDINSFYEEEIIGEFEL